MLSPKQDLIYNKLYQRRRRKRNSCPKHELKERRKLTLKLKKKKRKKERNERKNLKRKDKMNEI